MQNLKYRNYILIACIRKIAPIVDHFMTQQDNLFAFNYMFYYHKSFVLSDMQLSCLLTVDSLKFSVIASECEPKLKKLT